ncbi:MAG: M15 family metallopeptidase [Prevotella sp.]
MKRKKTFAMVALAFAILTLVNAHCVANDNSSTPTEDASATPPYYPGDTVPDSYILRQGLDAFFTSQEIPDTIFAIMQGKTYKADCTVPRSDLRYLLCLHRDIAGNAIVGEMVVNKAIAADVVDIFRELFVNGYPIERMRLIDYWDADDERSMTANNSSSFNFRFISHTTKVSKHGAGMAVDINPLYNPYHKVLADGTEVIEPAAGKPYLNRAADFDYKLTKGDLCYELFIQHGFEWGGNWTSVKDYQHFEK